MVKKLIYYLWEKRFLQYSIVGSSAFILDFSTLILLREFLSVNPILAVALNQLLILNYVFFLNKFWSFKANGKTLNRAVRFFVLMLGNYFFAVVWMWFFTSVIYWSLKINLWGEERDLWYLFVRLINILLAVSWNFLIYKYWIYKNDNEDNKNPTA